MITSNVKCGEFIGVAFRECLVCRGAPGDTYVGRPAMTERGSTHIDTAFMGLTSSGGVTVHRKLQAGLRPVQSFSGHVITAPAKGGAKVSDDVCFGGVVAGWGMFGDRRADDVVQA